MVGCGHDMNQSALEEFLASYSPVVRDLALQTRQLVMEAIPLVVEIVDPPSRIIAYGFGSKYADLICAIAPYTAHVNLIFSKGTELPDPQGLLSGTGKRARHVRITSVEALKHPGVRELIRVAVAIHAKRD
jgi:hypothetical protein